MQVACYCGNFYTVPGTEGECPKCGRKHSVPMFRKLAEAEMRFEVERLIAEHGVTGEDV